MAIILVFEPYRRYKNSKGNPLNEGVKCTGWEDCFANIIAIYLEQVDRQVGT